MSLPATHPLHGLLPRLEAQWRRNEAPLLDLLAPGLRGEELDELTRPLGLRLPVEARIWFGWHNGVTDARERPVEDWAMGAVYGYWAAQDLVEVCRWERDFAATVARENGADLTTLWRPSWFPMLKAGGNHEVFVLDCDDDSGPEAAAGHVGFSEVYPPTPEFTFTRLIRFWVEHLESGAYVQQDGRWHVRSDEFRIPEPRVLYGRYVM